MAEGTYGARQLAHAHVLSARIEAGEVALDLRIPIQQFEAERGWFGVDAVGAADGWGVLKLQRALAENARQRENTVANQAGCFFDLQRLGGIHYIVGSETVVQPTSFRADLLRHGGGEGDNVVLDLRLDFLDT